MRSRGLGVWVHFLGGAREREGKGGKKVLKSGPVMEAVSVIFPSTFRTVGCPNGLTMNTNSVPLTPVRVLGAFLKRREPSLCVVCVAVLVDTVLIVLIIIITIIWTCLSNTQLTASSI